jgi:hypothetical protein
MTTLFLQGNVFDFNKCFRCGDEILYARPGSIESDYVGLRFDHEGKTFGHDKMEVYCGDESVAFRFALPRLWTKQFENQADDLETFLAVSAGLTITKSESMKVDGETVKVIVKGTLNEISLLSQQDPAIKTSYARIVSSDSCNELKDDSDSGRLQLVGKVIGLLRKAKAADNGGRVAYNNVTSDYDHAAKQFQQALLRLAN